jgi:hypothetical protein
MSANLSLLVRIIKKLQHNLGQHSLSPTFSLFYNFEDMIVHFYRNLLLSGISSTDSTGEKITSLRPMVSLASMKLHNISPLSLSSTTSLFCLWVLSKPHGFTWFDK